MEVLSTKVTFKSAVKARSRSRPGQINQKVPLDYSLRAYLEVIFLVPRMKMSVQGTLAYKRVGGMIHSADAGRGVIGVIDVTNLMDDQDGRVWVHDNKQGFLDCQSYAYIEEWLGRRADEYWDKNFDSLMLRQGNCVFKPDCEWVHCDKCRKWRILPPDFDNRNLPTQWFCYMEPFKGKCADVEKKPKPGIVVVSTKRSRDDCVLEDSESKKIEADTNSSGSDETDRIYDLVEGPSDVLIHHDTAGPKTGKGLL